MSLPSRIWIVSGIVLIIVVAGLLMLSQALVANAAPDEPAPRNFDRWEQDEPPLLDCSRAGCHYRRVLEIQIHDILGSGVEVCWTCHDGTSGGVPSVPDAGGQGGHSETPRLHLFDGTLISVFGKSSQLCGQCHQGRYDAWEERAPEIPGTADIAKCTDCHNPHRLQIPRDDITEPHPLAPPTPTLTPPPPYAGLENPFPWDDTSAQEAGKVIFQESCAVCHVATPQSPALGPDFRDIDYRQILEERPDFYFWTVSEGRLDTTMPAFVSSLSEEARWQVLTYTWSFGGAVPATTATLTISVDGDGSTTPVVGEYVYSEDEAVTITATAASGWQFDNWTGDVANPNSATTTVTVDASKTVTANFSETPTPTPTPTPTSNPDGESSLNMLLIMGSVLGVLVVGGAVYYFVRK